MNKIKNTGYLFILTALLGIFITGCIRNNNAPQESTPWDKQIDLKGEWKFSIGDDQIWKEINTKDDDWEIIKVPSPWENEGFHGYDGYAWYRKHIKISSSLKGKGLYLNMGVIDDVDEIYVNGKLIGRTGSFPPDYETAYFLERSYPLPDEDIKFDSINVIAVRVYDNELSGGIMSGEQGIYTLKEYLKPDIQLEGLWKFNTGDSVAWSNPTFTDTSWRSIVVPGFFENQGYKDYDGFAWYRKTFFVPTEMAGKKYVLTAGKIDDLDEVYINGHLIGSHGSFKDPAHMSADQSSWEQFRGYEIPANLLQPGKSNIIAIRVYDGGLGGGIYQGPVSIISQQKYTSFRRSLK